MKTGEKQALGMIAVLALAFIVLAEGGYLTQYGVPKLFQQTPTGNGNGNGNQNQNTGTYADYVNGIGKFQIDCMAFNSADPTSTLTIGSAVDIEWFHFSNSVWTPDSGVYVPGNTNYFDAVASDNGYAWVMVQAHTATADFVDYQKILASSPLASGGYISGYQFTDVLGNGQKQFVFQYSLKNQAIPNSGYPVCSFSAYMLVYDGSAAIQHPTNLTGIGTSDVQKYVSWYEYGSATGKGIGVYKIELKIGTTDETKVRLVNMNIPGLGQVDQSAFTKTFTSTDIRYDYTFSASFDGADYMKYLIGTQNKNDFTTCLEFNLPSGNVDTTLTIFTLVPPTMAGSSLTDAVNCAS